MDDDISRNLVTAQYLAGYIGKTVRRVEQLRAEGVFKGVGRPMKYDLLANAKSYIKYLEAKAYGREKKQTDAQLMTEKLKAEKDFKKAKADIVALELKELQGKMHRAEDVEAIMTDHVFAIRSMLMAMPGKLAVDLAGTHTAPEQAERVKQEVNFILNELSNYTYNADEYKKRVMQRQGWEDLAEDKDEVEDDD